MPISLEKFHDVQRPLEVRIVEFLTANPNNAYALTELVAALEGYASGEYAQMFLTMDPKGLATRYHNALAKLLEAGKIGQAKHQGTTYYAISGASP